MLHLEFNTGQPIYTQLVEGLTRAIAAGEYLPGQRLPAVRELAAQLSINPNTVQRALAELERKSLVYSERTAGRFVTDDAELIASIRQQLAATRIQQFIAEMQALGFTRTELIQLLEKEVPL